MNQDIKILVAIPAYNEEKVIKNVINLIPNNIDISGKKHTIDVVVVDDGSTDNTSTEVLSSKRDPILVRHILNTGAGGATLTALEYADINDYDFMVTMDADGQHDIRDVLNVLRECIVTKKDLVIGNRLSDRSGQMSKLKIAGNTAISQLTRFFLGVNVKDSQSGLRAYSHNSIKNLRFDSQGYIFCSEMLMRAKNNNLTISEIDIKALYSDYSKSKGQSSWNGIELIRKILILRLMEIL